MEAKNTKNGNTHLIYLLLNGQYSSPNVIIIGCIIYIKAEYFLPKIAPILINLSFPLLYDIPHSNKEKAIIMDTTSTVSG